jgi:site-specific DNA recombinase
MGKIIDRGREYRMVARQRRSRIEGLPRAAIYCRVSTVGQEEEGTSLGTQEEYCRKYAVEHGYQIDESQVYRDVYSGTELWERPQLTKLREAIRQKAITGVIAYAIDRLSRDPVHLGVILSEAEHHGVTVEFVTEPLDNTPEGQLIRFVRGYAAKVEAEKIRERALRGKRARIQSGKIHNHGVELYGYRRDKAAGTRTIHEPEAAIVRQIFQWYMHDHLAFRAIVRRLNEQGIPSPSANKIHYSDLTRYPRWGRGQLLRILRDPTYKGEAIEWRYTDGGRLRPETEWMRLPAGKVPPIIPPSLWEAVQKRLETNRGEETRNQARPYLLRGRMECAVCHHAMYSTPEHGRRMYRCSSRDKVCGPCGGKRVRADDVETWVWTQVSAILQDPSIIATELKRRQSTGPDPTLVEDRESLQGRLRKFDKQQERLVRYLREAEEERVPWELIKRELAHIEHEKTQVQATLADIERRLAEQDIVLARLDALEAYCKHVSRQLERFDFEGKRLAFEALEIHVTANGKEWQLRGSIPLEDAGVMTQTSGDYGRQRPPPPGRA